MEISENKRDSGSRPQPRADGLSNARRLFRTGRVDEAESALRELPLDGSGSVEPVYGLGMVALQRSKLDEAAAWFAQSLAIDPNYADAYFRLGQIEELRGQWEAAAALYRKGVRLDADHLPAKTRLHNLRAARAFLEADSLRLDRSPRLLGDLLRSTRRLLAAMVLILLTLFVLSSEEVASIAHSLRLPMGLPALAYRDALTFWLAAVDVAVCSVLALASLRAARTRIRYAKRQLTIEYGLLRRRRLTLRIEQILGVTLTQTIPEKLSGYGTIAFVLQPRHDRFQVLSLPGVDRGRRLREIQAKLAFLVQSIQASRRVAAERM